MKVDDFLRVMDKVIKFRVKLEREGIMGEVQDIILKVYISELTPKINISMLKEVM